jgi:hypothetical protein
MLLKGEGFAIETASPCAVLGAETHGSRLCSSTSTTRGHHPGKRADLLAASGGRLFPARDRDGLGQHRARGRGQRRGTWTSSRSPGERAVSVRGQTRSSSAGPGAAPPRSGDEAPARGGKVGHRGVGGHAPVLQMIARVGPMPTPHHRRERTGKGTVARACTVSLRAAALATVNAGGFRGRLRKRAFGHVKGAFTDAKTDRVGRFEMADGGLSSRRDRERARQPPARPRARDGSPSGWALQDPSGRRADLVRHEPDLQQETAIKAARTCLPPQHHRDPPSLRERKEERRLAQHFLRQHA